MTAAASPGSTLREPGTMPLVEIYKELALQDPSGGWEFAPCIGIRRKPLMGREHNVSTGLLVGELSVQLRGRPMIVHSGLPALQLVDGQHYFMPDVCVVPHTARDTHSSHPTGLEIISAALPLVVEVWSPSTGDYDMETKFAEYRARGDEEIWRIHPYEATVTVWRRQPDGAYTESAYTGGDIPVVSLPGVVIPFDVLFQ
jgi:Uma2 family endonuclease